MKKKWLAALLALTMAAFAGCGGGAGNSSSAPESSAPESSAPESSAPESSAPEEDAPAESAADSSAGGAVEKIKAAGKIVMGTNAEFPPFEYVEGNDVVGVDADIAAEIAKDLGVELVIENMEFTAALLAVQNGQLDMAVAGITVDEERKKSMDFSNEYVTSSQYIIIAKDSGLTADSLKDAGVIIGVQNGTSGDFYATDDIKGDPNTEEVARYKNAILAAQDLMNGKIQAVIIDELPAKSIVAANEDKLELLPDKLTEEQYAIAVQKGNQELLDAINATLDRLESEGKIEEFLIKHMGA